MATAACLLDSSSTFCPLITSISVVKALHMWSSQILMDSLRMEVLPRDMELPRLSRYGQLMFSLHVVGHVRVL